MKFRTEVDITKYFDLNPDEKILTLGSCFADRMGERFESAGLDCLVNPFGVVYNPVSISSLLSNSLEQSSNDDWFEHDGRWLNTDYHGSVNAATKVEAMSTAHMIHESTEAYLQQSSLLILTLGTAFAYEDTESGKIVSNCHRLPAARFTRRLLSLEEMITSFNVFFEQLKQINNKIKIVFTVSPVRHVRDSLVENQQSKSVLNTLVHHFTGGQNIYYFPSYEIMMDDLRDYRFYEEDLVQPNSQALRYINEKFSAFCYSSEMAVYMKEVLKIKKRLSHKVMQQGSEAEQFTLLTAKALQHFRLKYPFSRIK
jgi:hypothetical protein